MTSDITFTEFADRWMSAFREQARKAKVGISGGMKDDFWEGRSAYEELSRKGVLLFIAPDPDMDEIFNFMAKRLFREIRIYNHLWFKVVDLNNDIRKVVAFLEETANKCLKEKDALKTTEVHWPLEGVRKYVAQQLTTLKRLDHWGQKVKYHPDELTGYVDVDKLSFHEPVLPEPEEHAEAYEKELRGGPYPKILRRTIDLDGRLQIRSAMILRRYAKKPDNISRRTICRLILLMYHCGRLARLTKDGHLRLWKAHEKERNLTIGAVEQKLQAAKIL
jgi:hypothetical protein